METNMAAIFWQMFSWRWNLHLSFILNIYILKINYILSAKSEDVKSIPKINYPSGKLMKCLLRDMFMVKFKTISLFLQNSFKYIKTISLWSYPTSIPSKCLINEIKTFMYINFF